MAGVPMAGVAWLVMSSTSWAEVAWLEPSSVQVVVFAMKRTERGAPMASFMDVVIGQASMHASPTPSIARGAALEELPPQERSAPLEVSAGMSRSLVRVATLDEVAEEREWGSVHMEIGDAVRALTSMLSLMRNIVAPFGQV